MQINDLPEHDEKPGNGSEEEGSPTSAERRRLKIEFHPAFRNSKYNLDQSSIDDRAASLFDMSLTEHDLYPATRPGRRYFEGPQPKIFEVVPSQFLAKARRWAPKNPQATASGFAQWIYSLYGVGSGSEEDKARGVALEQEVFEHRHYAACCVNNSYLKRMGSDWRLIHVGLHLDSNNYPEYFNIPNLNISKDPLKASPDLVYQNKQSSEVIIVEIKNSHLPITRNLWPNLWGQLWCYSQIDAALEASKVTVIGEVWGETLARSKRRKGYIEPSDRILSLRASVRRDPRKPSFNRFFQALFDIYRGA